jgi:hypothetical protein
MLAIATHALKRRSGMELTRGPVAQIWCSPRLAGDDHHPDEKD